MRNACQTTHSLSEETRRELVLHSLHMSRNGLASRGSSHLLIFFICITFRERSTKVVHSGNSWMRIKADQSAMCMINRHQRFPQHLANAPLKVGSTEVHAVEAGSDKVGPPYI